VSRGFIKLGSAGVCLGQDVNQIKGRNVSAIVGPIILLGVASTLAAAQDLEGSFSKSNELRYRGYEVIRSFDSQTGKSSATIKRKGAVLARLRNGENSAGLESTRFGLFPFLGNHTQQLIVEQYTGGAHCCSIYTIYDLYPRFRLIFSSKKYPVGDGFDALIPVDLDSDGIYELPQRIMTFDYFDDFAYVESPDPKVVFHYDRKTKIHARQPEVRSVPAEGN
jgi:hypothetical protein